MSDLTKIPSDPPPPADPSEIRGSIGRPSRESSEDMLTRRQAILRLAGAGAVGAGLVGAVITPSIRDKHQIPESFIPPSDEEMHLTALKAVKEAAAESEAAGKTFSVDEIIASYRENLDKQTQVAAEMKNEVRQEQAAAQDANQADRLKRLAVIAPAAAAVGAVVGGIGGAVAHTRASNEMGGAGEGPSR